MTATRAWDRRAVIAELRESIWRHLSPAATAHDVELDATALLQLDEADIARLADLHFVLHPHCSALLAEGPALLRRLPSSTATTIETSRDRVRGSIDWTATARQRAMLQVPVVVSRSPMRDPDVQPAPALALLLQELALRATRCSATWSTADGPALAARVGDVGRRAAMLAGHRALSEVTPTALTARDASSLASPRLRRRSAVILDAHRVHNALVVRRDVAAVREAVETYGFAVSRDSALFELLVVFRLRDALRKLGFRLDHMGLIEGRLHFDAHRNDVRLDAWYQHTPPGWSRSSRYRGTLRAHGLVDAHDLRPDLVLRIEIAGATSRWVVVEAKMSTTGKPTGQLVRRAVAGLLTYRANYEDLVGDPRHRALGVVWGEGLVPADQPISVCTPDHLGRALEMLTTA